MMRVAVGAVGVVCGAGVGPQALVDALKASRPLAKQVSGLGDLPNLVVSAPVVNANPTVVDDRKVDLLMAAVRQASVGAPVVPPARIGVFLGTGLSSITPDELNVDIYPFVKEGRIDSQAAVADLSIRGGAPARHMPARGTALVAGLVGAKGPSGTSFSACAASAEAIAAGARAIARGEADVVYVGGHDSMVHPFGVLSFHVLGAITQTTGRPFDRNRDGFLLGEGAAILRLERADLCASPLAYICGAGSSVDAHGITAPHPEGVGAEASMRRALNDADVQVAEVDWINAHATATPQGDIAESAAIQRIFGDKVGVSSLKGLVGHCLAAAGAVEAAATVLAMAEGFTPGTTGCVSPDDFGIQVIQKSLPYGPKVALSNSFGFGGQNTTLLFRCATGEQK
jgi:3-oxoacyl-[acyl-carrier-protein] synthase II